MKNFEWDENKNQLNLEKHGISFKEAEDVFNDPDRIQKITSRNGERRWLTAGKILGVIFTVVYTVRDITFRLISARRSNRNEVASYLNKNKHKKHE